jgi:uncharacterized protein with GYD domain
MKPQMEQWTKTRKELEKQGIKITAYWTLGRYDAVSIMEAPSEKEIMKLLLPFQHIIDTETLVAVPRDEAIELV